MGPVEHRFAHGQGFQRVVPADGDQGATDEAQAGAVIPMAEFAHGVAQPDADGLVWHLMAAAAGKPQAASGDLSGHLIEPFRVPWHDHQQRRGVLRQEVGPSIQKGRFFAFVGAATYQHWALKVRQRVVGRWSLTGLVELQVASDHRAFLFDA